jgi:arylsulfatase A-like enzyme
MSLVGCDPSTSEPAIERPNLIFIVADDLDWGSMPHLDRLQDHFAAGAVFENFFVTSPLGNPSRASLLRGQYPHNHGATVNQPPLGGFSHFHELGREGSTVATWLQEAGYATVFVGKYLNLYPDGAAEQNYVPPGWAEWYASIKSHYYDFRLNENGEEVYYPCCEDYETDVLTAKTVDFIRRAANAEDPFFIYVAPFAAHSPAEAPPRHQSAFGSIRAPRTPSFNEEDVSDKPDVIERAKLPPDAIDAIDEKFRQRLRSMLAVEDMVDSVLLALESTGTIDRTYVFFASDNGFHFANHRLDANKATAYDEDIRVPLYVRGPGITPGRTVRNIVLNNDIAPTLADLAGAVYPPFVDGRSFRPILFDRGSSATEWRNGFIVEKWRDDPSQPPPLHYTKLGHRSVRTRDYLYVEWDVGEYELYDQQNDRYELENLYQRADPAFITELRAWMDRLASCAGIWCRAAEDEQPPVLSLAQ